MLVTSVTPRRSRDTRNVRNALQDPNAFIHRVGRTARMWRTGQSLLLLRPAEDTYIQFLQASRCPLPLPPHPHDSPARSASAPTLSLLALSTCANSSRLPDLVGAQGSSRDDGYDARPSVPSSRDDETARCRVTAATSEPGDRGGSRVVRQPRGYSALCVSTSSPCLAVVFSPSFVNS